MDARMTTIEIAGVRPLLMHAGRLADPLDAAAIALARVTAKRAKTPADHAEIGRLEWLGGLWLHGGRPCIPGEALEAAFLAAARTRRRGKAASAGLLVEMPARLEHDGPDGLEALWHDERFRLRHAVRVRDARTMRTRPCFPVWKARFEVSFLPSVMDEAEIRETFAVAGAFVGVGDWRPRFGRFTVMA